MTGEKILVAGALCAAMAFTGTASAIIIVSDNNTTIGIDETTSAGMFAWEVDGLDHMFQEWFWLRLDNDTEESSVDDFMLSSQTAAGNQASLTYAVDAATSVTIDYTVNGGPVGSGTSTITERVRVQTGVAAAISGTLFAYTDLDIPGVGSLANFLGDTATYDSGSARQIDSPFVIDVTSSLVPDGWEIAAFPSLVNSLGDTSLTNLANAGSPFGPGDATFAFQYDFEGTGTVLDLTITKQLITVPEPGTVALLALGMLGLAFRRRHSA